ncbi:MAG: SDR family oxidoreductase [Gallionella sp.]|nr:SDR family oxidoreductase [Gallionella sp.]
MTFNDKKVLVTGATGFVGRVLCKELRHRGFQVRAAVRSLDLSIEGIESVVVGEIAGGTSWRDALRDVDVVIHLAARVHVMKDEAADPLSEFLKVNVSGTENLARQAAQAGVKRLVYVSSIKVNGDSTTGSQPFSESNQPNPQDPYGISKWRAEQALQRIAQETGLEIVIVRPPLVYGAGVKGNFISLMTAIDKDVPLPLAGAKNLRSLLYVGNLADALIVCAAHPDAAGQTYLLSDGEDISTAMLVKKIATALGRKSRSFYFPPGLLRAAAGVLGRSAQVERLFGSLQVNNQKIRNELSWCPPFTLEQGLRATAGWYNRRT